MKTLITGGLGQIGSHIAEMMLERGDEVLVIDNLATGRREHLTAHPRLQVVIDTIADRDLINSLVFACLWLAICSSRLCICCSFSTLQ